MQSLEIGVLSGNANFKNGTNSLSYLLHNWCFQNVVKREKFKQKKSHQDKIMLKPNFSLQFPWACIGEQIKTAESEKHTEALLTRKASV